MAWVNPRVLRTRDRVLTMAREILLELGPDALTYTALTRRSGVTRATLYKHWPTRHALLVDVVLTGPDVAYPSPGSDPRSVITEFLLSLRDGLSEPSNAAALLAVAAQAPHDDTSAAALTAIITDRRDALNTLLADTDIHLATEDYVLLIGPVLTQLLFARAHVTTGFLHRAVNSWFATHRTRVDGDGNSRSASHE